MRPTVTNHAPVTVALIANAIVAITIEYAKRVENVDFSGLEAHLQVLATAIGYLIKSKEGVVE